jgi:diaminopropionate ammonia-lyase
LADGEARYWVNSAAQKPQAAVECIQLEDEQAFAYHRSLAAYAPTELHALSNLARGLGLAEIWVKDESTRFGLNAFKVLGASYAIHRLTQRRAGRLTLCTATDGNHGRAVAWSARMRGDAAVVFVPAVTVAARIEAIAAEGAKVVVVDGGYDRAVHEAQEAARENDWLLVQDTAWAGYEAVPAWTMAGYTTILHELAESLLPSEAPCVDCVIVQAGVGSWAAAAAWHLCRRYGERRPKLVCVEPTAAACLLQSARAGRLVTLPGAGRTIMAGLNCETPSTIAWPILSGACDAFLAVGDDGARDAVRRLHRPLGDDPRIAAGESGAAGLAGLLAIMETAELSPLRDSLQLGKSSRVLLVNTEGVTDPDSFGQIVAGA